MHRLGSHLVPEVAQFYEEISVTPRRGLVHCESHTLRMFVSYVNRRNDGSKRKASSLEFLILSV